MDKAFEMLATIERLKGTLPARLAERYQAI
jgi:hypothetical protein